MISQLPIPVVVIGITRHTAILTAEVFRNTPYYLAAVLDITESPKAYQYSPQNLGTVLHTLHPRARALVTGTAVSDAMLEGIWPVWDEYVNGTLSEDAGGGSCWAALSRWRATPNAPPPEGWEKELLRQLDEAFR